MIEKNKDWWIQDMVCKHIYTQTTKLGDVQCIYCANIIYRRVE